MFPRSRLRNLLRAPVRSGLNPRLTLDSRQGPPPRRQECAERTALEDSLSLASVPRMGNYVFTMEIFDAMSLVRTPLPLLPPPSPNPHTYTVFSFRHDSALSSSHRLRSSARRSLNTRAELSIARIIHRRRVIWFGLKLKIDDVEGKKFCFSHFFSKQGRVGQNGTTR